MTDRKDNLKLAIVRVLDGTWLSKSFARDKTFNVAFTHADVMGEGMGGHFLQ